MFRREWPHFIAFDVLAIGGEDLRARPPASAPDWRHSNSHRQGGCTRTPGPDPACHVSPAPWGCNPLGAGELRNSVDLAAQAAPGDAQAGARSAVGTGGGRRKFCRRRRRAGRSTATKALIVIAAEEAGHGIGRIRLRRIPDGSATSLHNTFVQEAIEPDSLVHTDGWHG